MDALIGYSGFVGSTLLKQYNFTSLYRSTNIDEILGGDFDTVVCAGAPAQKWLANKDPQADLQKIKALIENLKSITCRKFILISTVDVFASPVNVDENSKVEEEGLHAYGLHRRYLERFVEEQFNDSLIVRLPGLVGPGLRKNIIYDFHNNNNIAQIESRGVYQFYPMVNLWYDIFIAIKNDLKLLHLTAEPVAVTEVAKAVFNIDFNNHVVENPGYYDMKSCYASLFSNNSAYQYNKRETLMAIRAYAQSELKENGQRL